MAMKVRLSPPRESSTASQEHISVVILSVVQFNARCDHQVDLLRGGEPEPGECILSRVGRADAAYSNDEGLARIRGCVADLEGARRYASRDRAKSGGVYCGGDVRVTPEIAPNGRV